VESKEDRGYFFWIDVTITPRSNAGGAFKLWEASELVLLPASTVISRLEDMEGGIPVRLVKMWDGKEWGSDDPGKYEGAQRLRLLVAVKPEVERRMKFQYYFETFGDVQLPRGSIVQG